MIFTAECKPPIQKSLLSTLGSSLRTRIVAGEPVDIANQGLMHQIFPKRVRMHQTPMPITPTIAEDYQATLFVNEDGTGHVAVEKETGLIMIPLPDRASSITLGHDELVEKIIIFQASSE